MDEQEKDYYQVLGIDRLASTNEIKKAYKRLAILYHPDKNLGNKAKSIEIFRQISEAYEILLDSEKRKNYDIYGLTRNSQQNHHKFSNYDAQTLFRKFFEDSSSQYSKDDDEDSVDSSLTSKNSSTGYTCGWYNSFNYTSNQHFNIFSNQNQFQNHGKDPSNHLMDIGGEGISKSISTSTKTVNGKTVTIRRTTVKKKDGSKDVTQQTIDDGVIKHKIYSLAAGQGFGNKAVYYKQH